MRKTINYVMTLLIVVFTMIMLTSYSGGKNEAKKELTFNDGSAKFVYDKDAWKEFESTAGPVIQNKSEKKAVLIGAGRIPSTNSYDKYVQDFKVFMKENSIDGDCIEGSLNGYPLLTYTEKKGNVDITFTVLIVKDGAGYYEVTFICVSDLYETYKDAAFEVMKTFEIVAPSKDQIIVDPELSEAIKTMDKMAGYDDEAVKKNLSVDGKELVGVWKYEKNAKYRRTYNSDGTFKENLNEDNTYYVEGTWEYDSNTRVITHEITRVMQDGKDMSGIIKNGIFRYVIKNFDGKRMYGVSLESLKLRTFIKEE